MSGTLLHKIAISIIPNIGDVLAKRLIAYCGGVEAVFKEKRKALEKIPGVGSFYANAVLSQNVFGRAEEEIKFIEKNGVQPIFYLDKEYPSRLTHCDDGPTMLYFKGETRFNNPKTISIVGTRESTDYGENICNKLIEELAEHNVLIISGLAYGIDICAHKSAIKNGLPTIGVVAHGLDKIYPSLHKPTAEKMLLNGGLLTDFMSKTRPDPQNFPRRNRIVAGLSDATIVIESKKDGGSLITADIANSYNRDVFAFPGRVGDSSSEGCNNLIKQNKAALIQSAKDVIFLLGWEDLPQQKKNIQKQLFVDLNPEEEMLISILKEKETLNIDEITHSAKLPMSKVSTLLLSLEFSGIVRSLPGKMYKLN